MSEYFVIALQFLTDYYIPFIIGYIIGGVTYATLKWVIVLYKIKALVEKIPPFDEVKNKGYSAKNWLETKRIYAAQEVLDSPQSYPPKATDNTGNLLMWAIFWPINLVYTMFADVVTETFRFIYRKFGSVLNSIASAILPK